MCACVRAVRFSIRSAVNFERAETPLYSVNSLYDILRMHLSESKRGCAVYLFLLYFCFSVVFDTCDFCFCFVLF